MAELLNQVKSKRFQVSNYLLESSPNCNNIRWMW